MKKTVLSVTAILVLLTSVWAQSLPSLQDLRVRTHLTEQLQALKPLPKVHYSWPLPNELLDGAADSFLYEYVRITRGLSVSGEWVSNKQIDTAVRICKQVNVQSQGLPASIAINYSPWHREFGKDLPPTDIGPSHHAELARFQMRMETIRQWVLEANSLHRTDVQVKAVLLDTERFVVSRKDKTWNEAITAKYDAIHDIAETVFPLARVEWYGLGIQESANNEGWSPFPWNTFENKAKSYSCSLYRVPELGTMRETFNKTYEKALSQNIHEVTPWVALASGYRRKVEKFQEWDDNWDYDLVYSWLLGAEINDRWYGDRPERFAPWNAAKIVVFYPAPFTSKSPAWGKHFVAYVRGANGVKSLPE